MELKILSMLISLKLIYIGFNILPTFKYRWQTRDSFQTRIINNNEQIFRDMIELENIAPLEHYVSDNINCAICLENINQNNLIRNLSCSHIFHSKCIDEWIFKGSATCPLCRKFLCKN